ncbi:MAG: phytoene/squalene synthase family protein [Bacteroidales bacterium]|jgi:phytoene/squalene synthetase|nr:phytoene/squalene synthase family protein [Bacteroidales bacterium]NPV36572.1 phytoene/squalene synthase family protein [Bacteroidales bacterium]
MELYNLTSLQISKIITRRYSTSFSLGVRMLSSKYREPIYAIYGFVRLADEIVDTFHAFDKKQLLSDFTRQTWEAINTGISTNPVLHSFQWVVREYNIDRELIEAFLHSMEMDLDHKIHDTETLKEYIYGSAEVVGLMCLRVFTHDQPDQFEKLKYPARKLGEAFQKVNFLRDIRADFQHLGRVYFPHVDFNHFTEADKKAIEADIAKDFAEAYKGIIQLKPAIRLGVYLAYRYYLKLFEKIKHAPAKEVASRRFRVKNRTKATLLAKSVIRNELNWV